jgi:hypothetical protein
LAILVELHLDKFGATDGFSLFVFELGGEGGNDTLTATDGVADTLVDGGSGTDTIRKDRVDPWSGT